MDQSRMNMPLQELVDELDRHLVNLQYATDSRRHYHEVFREFIRFAEKEQGTDRFSNELAARYLEKSGFPPPGHPCTLPRRIRLRVTVMRMLSEFCQHGCFQRRRYSNERLPMPEPFQSVFDAFFADCLHRGISPRSMRNRRLHIMRLFRFLMASGENDISGISPLRISDFAASQVHYNPRTTALILSNLRMLLRFLYLREYLPEDLSGVVPRVRYYPTRIPSVWKSEDVEKVLVVVDRGNPCGKRDYAMILLAARLGMRIGDIREMRLEHLRWDTGHIEMNQSKTGQPLVLPILDDVGWALIDYLKHGRPPARCSEIFVRHNAPFEPLGSSNNIHNTISKYLRLAGVPIPKGKRHGLHSLRHTLASRLLEQHVPLTTISEIMGHLASRSTKMYVKIDVEALRNCALDPEELIDAAA